MRVGIQFIDQGHNAGLVDIRIETVNDGVDAGFFSGLGFHAHIDFTGRMVADQNDGQARRMTVSLRKRGGLLCRSAVDNLRQGPAIDDLRRHKHPRLETEMSRCPIDRIVDQLQDNEDDHGSDIDPAIDGWDHTADGHVHPLSQAVKEFIQTAHRRVVQIDDPKGDQPGKDNGDQNNPGKQFWLTT